jgi:hypothetical protein
MDDPTDPSTPRWSASQSVKEKNAVQRAVTSLLDELAPEKVLSRGERVQLAIEQHRTPTGCVLQAASAALSVSWFADEGTHEAPGELHVLVWRGVVARRGSPRKTDATLVKELVLEPVVRAPGEYGWRATDGAEYDTAGLAAHCIALLEEQIRTTE